MIQGLTVAIKESFLLKAFLGLVMISFAIWGVGDAINPALDPNVVIKVDQVEIRAEELQRRFNQEVNELREALGPDFSAKQAADLGIHENIIRQLSQRASIEMAAREMGLIVPNETLRRSLQQQDAFKDETGNFNRSLFTSTLTSNNLTEQGFVDLLRGDVTRQTLLEPIALNAGAPDALVDPLFRYRAEQRMADVLYISDADVNLPAEPTEQELRTLYDENILAFSAPEYRTVSAALVQPKDLVPPESITQDEIKSFYDENIDRYRTQEKRAVNQLIFGTQFEAQAAHEQIQDGDSLAILAERTSLDAPIELGELSANDDIGFDIGPIFNLDVDSISTPVQTDFGWHLFEVTSRDIGSIKALPVVREEIIEFIVQDRAFDEMYEATIYMEDQFAAGIAVNEVANAPGFSYVYFDAVDRDGRGVTGQRLSFTMDQDRFLRLAYATERGIDSQLIETDEYAYILRVEDIIPPAPKPYERVKGDVQKLWGAQARIAATAKMATAFLDDIGPSSDLPAMAESDASLQFVKLGPVTRFGDSLRLDAIIPAQFVSPEAMEGLFNARVGDVIKARVAAGYIVARMIEVVPPDKIALAENRGLVANAVKSSIANDLVAEFTDSLTNGFDVTLNREIIDQLVPQ